MKFQLGHVFSDMDWTMSLKSKDPPTISFNWATSFQTWIGAMLCIRPMRNMKSFNWATSFQTWIEIPDEEQPKRKI